jgi:hypothetical protein
VMLAYGWQGAARLWALLLVWTAVVFWLDSAEDPGQAARRAAARLAIQVEPLRRLRASASPWSAAWRNQRIASL